MSSILDALNKLEEEKAARRAGSDEDVAIATPEDAAAELLGLARTKSTGGAHTFPWVPVISALFVGVAMSSVALVFVFRMIMVQPDLAVAPKDAESVEVHTYTVALRPEEASGAPTQAEPLVITPPATATPQPTPMPAVAPPPPPPPPPAPTAPPPAPVVESAPPPIIAPTPIAQRDPVPTPQVPTPAPIVRDLPMDTPTDIPAPAPDFRVAQASAPVAPAIPPPQPRSQRATEVDVDALPRLSANDRGRLGLDNLRLNVLREADSEQPEGMAIINLKKVYVGEMIPGTRARLIGVQATGIGIEMEDSRERYRISR